MNAVEPVEFHNETFTISTNPGRLDMDTLHDFLSNRAYWSPGIPREIIEKAVQNSLCFGVYAGEKQVGFARVVSDYVTYAYLCDLFIIEGFRGRGLSKWLVACIRAHPDLQNLRRWQLITRDAHTLYARFGFKPVSDPERIMEIVDMDFFRKSP